jgi:hypothetical protein
VGLPPLVCWDCGFEPRRGQECLLSELCVTRHKPPRRAENSYRVWCLCDREASTMKRPQPNTQCSAIKKIIEKVVTILLITFSKEPYFHGLSKMDKLMSVIEYHVSFHSSQVSFSYSPSNLTSIDVNTSVLHISAEYASYKIVC